MPSFTLTAAVLGTPDPRGLARFYQRLLGWPLGTDPAAVRSVLDQAEAAHAAAREAYRAAAAPGHRSSAIGRKSVN